ncbi:archaeal proteasome endopeptidase complex subunit beta [Candidatus Bathyarchaeota archaeon]|nr:archaeal proteasome endopeptidase complex subunit beta [Candidatus Bathyarchaeota archaeon]
MQENIEKIALKGTTTVGVVCTDGVILASDTRVTMGYFVAHKQGKKIYQIDDHIGMTISGGVADAQYVVEVLKVNAKLYKLNNGRPMPIKAASRLVGNVLFSARGGLMAQILVGGVDSTGPHVFSLDPFGSLIEEKCVATGSGSPVAYGVLEDKFKEDNQLKDMLPVVVRAVDSAMKRDIASGNNYDIAVITKEGYRALSTEEKKGILGGS